MKLSPARSSALVESAAAALVSLALVATPVAAGVGFDCSHILVDGQKFDFGALKGPHSVVTSIQHETPWEFKNTTYTLDLCKPLEKKGGKDSESCPNGARVCAITRGKRPGEDDLEVIEARPIAGDMQHSGGSSAGLDGHSERLKTSDSISDSKKVGVRIAMYGARWPMQRGGTEQRAIIEMVCSDLAGTEGEVDPTGEWVSESAEARRLRPRADGDEEGDQDGDGDDEDDGGDGLTEHQLMKLPKNETALIFESFGPLADNGKIDVLRLTWYTKLACERDDQKDGGDSSPNGSEHWGFFTWLVIIAFMGTAAYLIFGSWLNYNRYGARGWDLLPHGDTIRDIPYLLKDWTRRVMNTVQGSGSRGGYAAV
ncbi:unnamed protein product [Discula destructiva]